MICFLITFLKLNFSFISETITWTTSNQSTSTSANFILLEERNSPASGLKSQLDSQPRRKLWKFSSRAKLQQLQSRKSSQLSFQHNWWWLQLQFAVISATSATSKCVQIEEKSSSKARVEHFANTQHSRIE